MNEYESKLKEAVKGRVVVYIDAANLEQSVKGMFVRPDEMPSNLKHLTADKVGWFIDYKCLADFFRSLGNLSEIRYFTPELDSEGHKKFRAFLKNGLGFKLQTKPLREYADHTADKLHRKANFDVEISTDATYLMNTYDTLILFSGDCDFEYLIKFLRGQSKIVIGFSRAGHIARELPPVLSEYFDIANFRSVFLKIKAKSPGQSPGPRS